jgi:flavin reductase (DIM6/NTAB) family NADH-FMN oxidoreductase RutF
MRCNGAKQDNNQTMGERGTVMEIDGRELRNALGRFATGVCIISTVTEAGEPMGLTANSFASVSLDPPLVLWSLQNNSECYQAFEKADKFAVNILAQDQQDKSNAYAKKGDHALAADDFRLGKTGTPILRGAVTSFECRVWARYPGGDHVILVGEVLEMESNANKAPLLFHAGKYGAIR